MTPGAARLHQSASFHAIPGAARRFRGVVTDTASNLSPSPEKREREAAAAEHTAGAGEACRLLIPGAAPSRPRAMRREVGPASSESLSGFRVSSNESSARHSLHLLLQEQGWLQAARRENGNKMLRTVEVNTPAELPHQTASHRQSLFSTLLSSPLPPGFRLGFLKSP